MNGFNPCDVRKCESCWDCCFSGVTNEYECTNYNCFLNREGDCLVSVFEKCKAWRKGGDSDAKAD